MIAGASHSGGSRNTPSRFMLQKPEISAVPIGHLARMLALSTFTFKLEKFENAGFVVCGAADMWLNYISQNMRDIRDMSPSLNLKISGVISLKHKSTQI